MFSRGQLDPMVLVRELTVPRMLCQISLVPDECEGVCTLTLSRSLLQALGKGRGGTDQDQYCRGCCPRLPALVALLQVRTQAGNNSEFSGGVITTLVEHFQFLFPNRLFLIIPVHRMRPAS